METGFPDKQEKHYKAMKNPWDFRMPIYDERSSSYVNAGSHYGTGFNQPIGHEGPAKLHVDCLPMGKVKAQEVVFKKQKDLPVDIVQ